MTTIQDRIIKANISIQKSAYEMAKARDKAFKAGEIKNGKTTNEWNEYRKAKVKLSQVISKSIKEVEEETRKEIFEKVGEIVGNEKISLSNNEVDKIWEECVNAERFRIGHSIFLLKQSLSITNKEKQK